MKADQASRVRPYWHVDAKWICGVLLLVMLSLTLLVYGLVLITDEKPAKETLTMSMALAFSPNGLDDPSDIDTLLQQFGADTKGDIRPISGFDITMSKKEIQSLSPRQLRLKFFGKFADAIYGKGTQGLTELATTGEMKKTVSSGLGPMVFFTSQTHAALGRSLLGLLAVSAVLLAGMVFFSHRFGRLASAGFVLSAVGLPGAAVFALASLAADKSRSGTPGAPSQSLEAIAGSVLPPLLQIAGRPYVFSLVLGLVLMFIAVVGSAVCRLRNRPSPS
ncbi:MAG: hypothetical protein ACYC1U_00220 [Candidatus Aquicultorales bacterium]